VPGYNLKVFNEQNEEVPAGTLGKVVIKLPMPPAFMNGLWGNHEAFVQKYLAETPGYYTTGDAGVMDERGYVHIMTRMDDVINTAGHRLSTGRLEEVINDHGDVVESAVVGYDDGMRGEVPLAFVILKGAAIAERDDLQRIGEEVQATVRKDVGQFAKLAGLIFMDRLPKTRSGKILRGTVKSICNGQEYKIPSTIEDLDALTEITDAFKTWLASTKKQ